MTISFDVPTRAATRTGRPLHIAHVERRVFATPSPAALDPDLRVYLGDLARPYGLALREDLLRTGTGQSYGEMGADLIRAVVPPDAPIDLLVLAFASPDIRPGQATASYLSGVCPGAPMGFAVTDQGAATAFTALRLIQRYASSGGCRRALLLVTEQATLHYDPPSGVAVTLPRRHAAVAIRLDVGTAGGRHFDQVRVRAGVTPGAVAGLLDGDRPDGARVAAGPRLPDAYGAAYTAPAGQPFTGVWWRLADAGGDVLLADYDPQLRYLATATVTTSH